MTPREKWGLVLAAVVAGGLGLVRVWPPAAHMTRTGVGFGYYLWAYRHFAYSDLVAEYSVRNLYAHPILYLRQYFEYPPGIGVAAWLAAWLPGLGGYLVANAVVLTAALAGASLTVAGMRGFRAARPWVSSPLLLIYAVYNWDLLGILAWGLSAFMYGRRRWFLSGLCLGLGAAIKLFPAVLWPFMAAAALRDGQRSGAWRLSGGAALGIVLPSLPVASAALGTKGLHLSNHGLALVEQVAGWRQFLAYNAVRGADPGFWQWVTYHDWLSIPAVNLITLGLVGLAGLTLVWLVWRGFDPLMAGAILLAWWFLVNKVYSPQYMLWVLYAFTVAGIRPWQVWLTNVAGLLDFGLAMVWLNLGTARSPAEPLMGIYVAPLVVLFRDVTLGLCVRAGWPWGRRSLAHNRS